MRRLIAILLCSLFAGPALAAQVFLAAGSSTTVPVDWNDFANTVEVIGGGGAGGNGCTGGGGAGAYAKIANLALVPGASVSYAIGAAGSPGGATAGGDTWFKTSGTVLAKGAGAACTGGLASGSIGTTKYSGGTGLDSPVNGAGGGAGAAGPHGAGGDGIGDVGDGQAPGGAGDAGFGGVGGTGSGANGGAGGNGTEFNASHGAGGGAGAGSANSGAAGLYGAGGAISGTSTNGSAGLIVLTYTPRARVSSGAF